jgi:hypothetical protein
VRAFLLLQTADRYVLLTIANQNAERLITVIRKEQVQMFRITAQHVNVFQNPASTLSNPLF